MVICYLKMSIAVFKFFLKKTPNSSQFSLTVGIHVWLF